MSTNETVCDVSDTTDADALGPLPLPEQVARIIDAIRDLGMGLARADELTRDVRILLLGQLADASAILEEVGVLASPEQAAQLQRVITAVV